MANRIEFSIPNLEELDYEYAQRMRNASGERNQDNEGVGDCEAQIAMAELENLPIIGGQTLAELMQSFGAILGAATTKAFLEQCKQSRAGRPKSDTIYDITDGGEVSTDEIRPADVDYRMKDEVFVRFNTKFSEPPAVIMGLKYLRIRGKETHGITGTIQPVHDHLFGLCAKASEDSEYKGGFTWLAVPSYEHPLLQVGTESTTRDPGWARTVDMSWTKLSKKITFQSPYDLRPRVVIWLTHIECNPGEDEDVKTVAIKITPTGFTAKILAWGHIDMYNFGISWFAYPLDTPGIRSGNAYLTDGTMGVVSFNEPFSNTPRRVLVGLNSFYIPNHDVSTCIDIIYEAVSERGMGVRVENHENSKIKSAGVAYIAME